MSTQLETLPNEILLDLFEYISLRDLYYSFMELNKRFNDVIRSLHNLSLIIYKNEQLLIDMFAHKIIRLEIVNYYLTIDFNQFPNLRSLILHQANDNQLGQIRHELLPNLTYLFISIVCITLSSRKLAQNLFSNQLPSLQYVYLGLIATSDTFSWSSSPSLHSLCIYCNEPILIRMILLVCPNLKRFQVNMHAIDQRIDLPNIPLNHSLKHFILLDYSNSLSLETIDNILLYIPNIKQLYLQYSCRELFVFLAQILSRRLKYLTRFDCNINESSNESELNTLETIRQIHPSFNRLLCTVVPNGYRLFTTDGLYAKANLFS